MVLLCDRTVAALTLTFLRSYTPICAVAATGPEASQKCSHCSGVLGMARQCVSVFPSARSLSRALRARRPGCGVSAQRICEQE